MNEKIAEHEFMQDAKLVIRSGYIHFNVRGDIGQLFGQEPKDKTASVYAMPEVDTQASRKVMEESFKKIKRAYPMLKPLGWFWDCGEGSDFQLVQFKSIFNKENE